MRMILTKSRLEIVSNDEISSGEGVGDCAVYGDRVVRIGLPGAGFRGFVFLILRLRS